MAQSELICRCESEHLVSGGAVGEPGGGWRSPSLTPGIGALPRAEGSAAFVDEGPMDTAVRSLQAGDADATELVRQVVAGDPQAQEAFVSGRYGGVVTATARGYLATVASRDRMWAAEDLEQLALLHVVKPNCAGCSRTRKREPEEDLCPGCERDWWVLRRWLDLPEPKCSLTTWLITIIKRLCSSIYDSAGRQPQLHGQDIGSLDSLDLAPFAPEEQKMLLRASLAGLSEADLEVIRLRLEGCSTKDIADRLGISEDAANSRIHRALKRARGPQEKDA